MDWISSDLNSDPLLSFCRESARLTNVGRIMEAYGTKLLGSSYQDPIASYNLFYKFSVQNPEVTTEP